MRCNIFSRIWNRLVYFVLYYSWINKERERDIMESFFRTYNHIDIKRDRSIDEDKRIYVCTWNIHRGYDIRNRFKLYEVIEYLSLHNYDIVCLQEINNDMYTIDGEEINTTMFIAKKLGYYYYYYNETTILSKYKIIDKYNEHMYTSSKAFGNFKVSVAVDINGQEVRINNFHLNCDIFGHDQKEFVIKSSFGERVDEINREKTPLIVCGDFNSVSWFKGLKIIKDKLGYPKDYKENTKNVTFPTPFPCLGIDKIYTNERLCDNKIREIENHVDYSNRLSDHYPLITKIEISF